jgi:Domain of unknown function (DUF1707)/Cell wall-active antibiotics response 4TMS YvqF
VAADLERHTGRVDDTSDPGHPATEFSLAERAHALERLRAAAAAGSLTYQELADRTGRAYAARTRAEVEAVTGDLPGATPSGPVPAPREKRWLVASIANERVAGRWTAPSRLTAVAVLGDVIIDLPTAELRGTELSIQATALVGDVHVVVPRGATVELSGIAVLGRKTLAVEPADFPLAVPVVRVSAFAIIGDVIVATQPPTSRIKSAIANRSAADRVGINSADSQRE